MSRRVNKLYGSSYYFIKLWVTRNNSDIDWEWEKREIQSAKGRKKDRVGEWEREGGWERGRELKVGSERDIEGGRERDKGWERDGGWEWERKGGRQNLNQSSSPCGIEIGS